MTPKRRDQCVLFVDDCLDSIKIRGKAEALGFAVKYFTDFFPRTGQPAKREESVKDNRVIKLCASHGFTLFTTDHQMQFTFLNELKATNIGVVATANNGGGLEIWFEALAKAKNRILRDHKKYRRPYFSILAKSGEVHTKCLEGKISRRTRPSEKEQGIEPDAIDSIRTA